MAILPRTLIAQPAAAAVAAVSLFGFTVLATSAQQHLERARLHQSYAAPCASVDEQLGPRQFWQHADFVRYAACFEDANDSRGVIEVTTDGLLRYPKSQVLYNMKGYHQIELHEFSDAIDTLEAGLVAVPEQTSGVMENNLAWAYLWVDQPVRSSPRALVQASLDKDATCEALHTGLFVEFDIARKSSGIAQAEALRNFQSLRTRYQDCENRDSKWNTAVEAAGAAVLYAEVEQLMGTPWDQRGLGLTMRVTATNLRNHHASSSVALLCNEAMPLADLRPACVEDVQNALRVTRR